MLKTNDVLLVIDVQRDFLPGGCLAVPNGDSVVPIINGIGKLFNHVVLTQDWHPARHISFASTHGKRPFEDTAETHYGTQSLWPDHTVQGTMGADFAPALDLPHAELIVRKGVRQHVDSYSAFLENDHQTPTGLAGYLRERGLSRLFLCGLAWDYCVGNTALDGVALGFLVHVVTDAVLGISAGTVNAMTSRWRDAGVQIVRSSDLVVIE